jgi:hypothetical protein
MEAQIMSHKVGLSLAVLLLCASAAFGQSRTLYVGDVELRLGMPEESVKRLLSKYTMSVSGSTFLVTQYNQRTKLFDVVGGVGFEQGRLSYISRSLDTSAWPADEGFSIARALYDAFNGSIALTDSDGAKRANARIVISNQDASQPRLNLRMINIYIDERKITLIISDGEDGKSVSAQVDIRSKPW